MFCVIDCLKVQDQDSQSSSSQINDIEDFGRGSRPNGTFKPMATKRKRDQMEGNSGSIDKRSSKRGVEAVDLTKSWRDVLGDPPSWGPLKVRYCTV